MLLACAGDDSVLIRNILSGRSILAHVVKDGRHNAGVMDFLNCVRTSREKKLMTTIASGPTIAKSAGMRHQIYSR